MAKILLMEDESDIANYLATALRYRGHEVTVASNGAIGFALLQREDFDGAIVDLVMPQVNGWEFIDRMDASDRKVPIICISGYMDPEPPHPFHPVPILTKPFETEELLAMINKYFGKGGRDEP